MFSYPLYLWYPMTPWMTALFVLALAWSGVWKAIALWKSARHNQLVWFVVLCIVNTLGLLEIIYLAFFQRKQVIAKAAPKKARKRR